MSTPSAAGAAQMSIAFDDAGTYRIPVLRVSMVRERTLDSRSWKISDPSDVYDLVGPMMAGMEREMILSVLLDTKQVVLAVNVVSIGDLASSIANPREILKPAILAGASGFILVHNHPSGDPTHSQEDVAVTRRMMQAAQIMAIDFHDHVIVGDGVWSSLKQKGVM